MGLVLKFPPLSENRQENQGKNEVRVTLTEFPLKIKMVPLKQRPRA